MAENSRPPVAIRIVRPYETEEHLLEHELETIGKTSVILIGAHPRPTGVILRFEVTLASGVTVLRGEGRVLAHKENAFRGQAGLTLRFTRLDPRSKSVVDRATAMREARSQGDGGTPSRPVPGAPPADGAIAEALTASTPAPAPTTSSSSEPPSEPSSAAHDARQQEDAVALAQANAREKANATARTNAKRTGRNPALALTPPPIPVDEAPQEQDAPHELTPVTSIPGEVAESVAASASARPAAEPVTIAAPALRAGRAAAPPPSSRRLPAALPSQIPPGMAPSSLEPPGNRADLLGRLRERAQKLPAARVEEILSARRTP